LNQLTPIIHGAKENLNQLAPIIEDYEAKIKRLEDTEKIRKVKIARLEDVGKKRDKDLARLEDLAKKSEADLARLEDLEQIRIPAYKSEIGRLKRFERRSMARIHDLEEDKEELKMTLRMLRKDKNMCLYQLDVARCEKEELKAMSIKLKDDINRLHRNL